MTYGKLDEQLKRLRESAKEIVGEDLPKDYRSHRRHPAVPKKYQVERKQK